MEAFAAIIAEMKGWKSTIDQKPKPQQMQRYLQESDRMITPEEVENLVGSYHY